VASNNTQIIPSFEPSKAQLAIAEVENLKAALVPLEQEARAIKIETAADFESGGMLLKRIRDNRKQGEWTMKPLKSIADTIKNFLRTAELAHSNKCEQIESILTPKLNDYKRREAEAAAAEQRRINEERQREANRLAEEQGKRDMERAAEEKKARDKEIADAVKAGEVKKREADRLRKEAEEREKQQREQASRDAETAKQNVQQVTVQPNTPKIAGLRQRKYPKWRMKNIDLVPRLLLYPNDINKTANFPRITDELPKLRSKDKSEAENKAIIEAKIPGIEYYEEDAI
jgi:hypothetical protein